MHQFNLFLKVMKLEPNKNIIKAQTLALIQLQLKIFLIWTPCANIVLVHSWSAQAQGLPRWAITKFKGGGAK